jgi:uncharacterized protein
LEVADEGVTSVGKRERYEPGTFCWVDLATTDPASARAFYGGLFGWEAEDTLGGGGGTYTVLRLDGDEVGGLYEIEAGERAMGVKPHWLSYVSVESADEAAARAEELGGSVFMEAFDAADFGRMAVIGDPTGAVLAAWEPQTLAGARRVNDPGCFTWNELQSRDPEPADGFYSLLFGWETEPVEQNGNLVYMMIRNAGRSNGGVMPMTEQHGDAPPYWLVYFTVSSCDDAVAKVRELGGGVLAGPMNVGAGRIAVVSDPQGAAFALFEGEIDD